VGLPVNVAMSSVARTTKPLRVDQRFKDHEIVYITLCLNQDAARQECWR